MKKVSFVSILVILSILFINGCMKSETEWRVALKKNKILAYEKYMQAYPKSKHYSEAMQKMKSLIPECINYTGTGILETVVFLSSSDKDKGVRLTFHPDKENSPVMPTLTSYLYNTTSRDGSTMNINSTNILPNGYYRLDGIDIYKYYQEKAKDLQTDQERIAFYSSIIKEIRKYRSNLGVDEYPFAESGNDPLMERITDAIDYSKSRKDHDNIILATRLTLLPEKTVNPDNSDPTVKIGYPIQYHGTLNLSGGESRMQEGSWDALYFNFKVAPKLSGKLDNLSIYDRKIDLVDGTIKQGIFLTKKYGKMGIYVPENEDMHDIACYITMTPAGFRSFQADLRNTQKEVKK